MPGPLLHVGATVTCAHGGQATPLVPNPRVMVGGQPTVTLMAPWLVAGCALPPPPAANGPCVTAAWVTGATRAFSNGAPLLLMTSQAICTPTGTPVFPVVSQIRAVAT